LKTEQLAWPRAQSSDAGPTNRHPYVLAVVAASLPHGAVLTDYGAIVWHDTPAAPGSGSARENTTPATH